MTTSVSAQISRIRRWVAVGGTVGAFVAAFASIVGLVLSVVYLEWPYWLMYAGSLLLFGAVALRRLDRLRKSPRPGRDDHSLSVKPPSGE
jgi:hypothetical protein